MAISEKELLGLKLKAEKAKEENARLQGKIDQLMSQLKKDFGCKDLKAAGKLREKYEKEVEELETEMEVLSNQIEKEFNI